MKIRFSFLSLATAFFVVIGASFTLFFEVPYNEKRLAEGILLLLCVVFVCSSGVLQRQWLTVVKRLNTGKIPFVTIIGLIFVLGIISSVLAENPLSSFLLVSHYFLLFNAVIVAVICYQYKPKYFEIGFLFVVGITAGVYLINVAISYGYVYFVPDFPLWPKTDFMRVWFKDIGFMYPEPFLNFANIRFFNHLQTWTLPLLSLLVLYIPKRQWAFSKIAFIILCGWWMLVFASDARGTTVASFLVLGIIFYLYRTKAVKWLRVHSLSAVTGFIFYGIFFKLLPLLVNTTGSRTAFSRYKAGMRTEWWENAINTILQNPLLGIGPMHFSAWGSKFPQTPHNIYLQFSGEWGIPAIVLLFVVIGVGTYYWYKRSHQVINDSPKNSKKINIRVALTASLLAVLIHGLVSGITNTPLSQIMMILVVGWMIGLSISDDTNEEGNSNSLWRRACLIGVNLLAAGFLIWSYAVQVPNLDENRQRYLEMTEENRLSPRYWDQGVIGLEKYDEELDEQSASE